MGGLVFGEYHTKGNLVKEYPPSYDLHTLSEDYENRRKKHEEQIRQSTHKIRLDIAVKSLTDDKKQQKNIRDYYRKIEGIYTEKIDRNLWIKAGEFYLRIWETYQDLQEKIPPEYKPLEELYFIGYLCGRIAPKPLTEAELLRERIRQPESQINYLKPDAEARKSHIEKLRKNPRKTPQVEDDDLW